MAALEACGTLETVRAQARLQHAKSGVATKVEKQKAQMRKMKKAEKCRKAKRLKSKKAENAQSKGLKNGGDQKR